jgi:hypothetical protein
VPRNCFWGPRNILYTNSLYNIFLGPQITFWGPESRARSRALAFDRRWIKPCLTWTHQAAPPAARGFGPSLKCIPDPSTQLFRCSGFRYRRPVEIWRLPAPPCARTQHPRAGLKGSGRRQTTRPRARTPRSGGASSTARVRSCRSRTSRGPRRGAWTVGTTREYTGLRIILIHTLSRLVHKRHAV